MRVSEFRVPPVVVFLMVGAVMWVTARSAPALGFVMPARLPGAAILTTVGVVIALLGVASFRRAGTTVDPLHPEAASTLVVSGIYGRTRNPIYLGLLLVLIGWAVYLANALSFVLPAAFVPLMNRLQILAEERVLAAKFGEDFAAYRAKVRRWL